MSPAVKQSRPPSSLHLCISFHIAGLTKPSPVMDPSITQFRKCYLIWMGSSSLTPPSLSQEILTRLVVGRQQPKQQTPLRACRYSTAAAIRHPHLLNRPGVPQRDRRTPLPLSAPPELSRLFLVIDFSLALALPRHLRELTSRTSSPPSALHCVDVIQKVKFVKDPILLSIGLLLYSIHHWQFP